MQYLDAIMAALDPFTLGINFIGVLIGMIIGALILSVMSNGLDILRVASYYQNILKGLIIVVIVLIDVRSKRKRG